MGLSVRVLGISGKLPVRPCARPRGRRVGSRTCVTRQEWDDLSAEAQLDKQTLEQIRSLNAQKARAIEGETG
jgi:hypothetical protein